MARKNDLAKLAALAGLGMVLTNQYRNKVDLTEKDSKPTEDLNPTRGAGYNSTETRLKAQAQSIAEADKSSKATTVVNNGSSGTTTAGPAAPPNLDMPPAVNLPKVKPPAKVEGSDLAPIVSQKQLANVPTNFGKLVNPFPVDNKATTKEAVRQAAIEAIKKHAEDQKAIMAERRRNQKAQQDLGYGQTLKRGGAVKKMASGGMTSSASSRGDGIATKGKTRGKIC